MIMEFFFEMILTVVVALLFSFLVAKLVTAGNGGNDLSSDQVEIGVGDEKIVVSKDVCSGLKVDACVIESEKGLLVVEENVDRFGKEDDLVDELHEADLVDEHHEAVTGNENIVLEHEELVGLTGINLSETNVIADEMISRGLDEQSGELLVEFTDSISQEKVEIVLQGAEERSDSSGGDVVVAESEEVRVEEKEEEKEEVRIEEDDDDDWEGIERSELEKAFAATAKLLEESGRAEEIGAQAKLELYGLHMIATSGPCRETQPMAVMISARAKWNAWQKLGNMSQEEAMEQYLALVSKEVPGLMNADQTFQGKGETSG